MADIDALVAQLISITSSSPEVARNLLEAVGYDLQAAISLHFDEGAGPGAAAPGLPPHGIPPEDIGGEGASAQAINNALADLFDNDGVRAPLPTKRERLYTDHMLMARPARPMMPQPERMGAFHDVSDMPGRSQNGTGLSGLFEPPKDLIFKGRLAQLKDKAQSARRWVLINVLDNTEFSSHQLNRDTWGDKALREIVGGSFIFTQAEHLSEEGKEIVATYRLNKLPVIVVVDPITGAILRQWTGFIEPARLAEELVPFMDTSIDSKDAARLGNAHKRKQAGLAIAGASTSKKNLSEDEQLQLALQQSMMSSTQGDTPVEVGSSDDDHDNDSEDLAELSGSDDDDMVNASAAKSAPPVPSAPTKSAEEVAAEAAAQLPPEPPIGGEATRLAVRLPDGKRLMRRFLQSDPLQVVHTWCISECLEAAGGRTFQLVPGGLGAPTSDAGAALDQSKTLGELGIINTMLILKLT